ncbi:hypothetical protein [Nesterenkonia aerolata]|uniref:Uncharacterized protein n=1 Tax=Nesterenkonia aerolata TaxID=3074079 RepID=A0ABU2DVL0_9MICC|nr:hypothetical protein [Nesterenkonia sp. LY-0111]MDR8020415.1 hypothetical protein [Nesterenkonia sp. LY-0111]
MIEYASKVLKAFKKDLDRQIVRRMTAKLEAGPHREVHGDR